MNRGTHSVALMAFSFVASDDFIGYGSPAIEIAFAGRCLACNDKVVLVSRQERHKLHSGNGEPFIGDQVRVEYRARLSYGGAHSK